MISGARDVEPARYRLDGVLTEPLQKREGAGLLGPTRGRRCLIETQPSSSVRLPPFTGRYDEVQHFAMTVTYSPFVLSPSTPVILSPSKDDRRSGQACRRYILSLSKGRTWRSWFDKPVPSAAGLRRAQAERLVEALTTSGNVTVIAKW